MSLQVWLPLNGNLNNQGLNNISVTNNGAIVDNSGKIGKCYSFDGINDYIQIPTMVLDLSRVSICGWIKWGAFNSWSRMFDFQNSASGSTGAIGIANNGTTSTITVFGRTSSGGSLPDTNIGLSAVANTWYHIALTLNNTTAKVYLNGTLSKTFTLNSALGVMTLNNNYLGKSGWSSDEFFQGSMNDFRIYNHCLSSKEIAEIAKGLVLHYPLNNGGFGAPNLIKGNFSCTSTKDSYSSTGDVVCTLSADDILVNKGKTLTLSYRVSSLGTYTSTSSGSWASNRFGIHGAINYNNSSGSSVQDYPFANLLERGKSEGLYSCSWTIPNNISSINSSLGFAVQTNPSSGFAKPGSDNNETWHLKDVKLEWGSSPTSWIPNGADTLYTSMGLNSTIELDCSGYSNNGTRSGTLTYNSNSMRYSGCLTFEAKSHIKIAKPMTISNASQFTVAMWVKPESGCGGYAIVASNYNNPSSGFWMAINTEGSGTWFYNGTYAKGNALLTVGSWSHIAMVFNVGVITWYVNGTATTTSDVSSRTTQFTDYIAIGNSYTGSSWNTNFVGSISDFRMYGTALSTAQVKELYSVPQSIDKNGNLYAHEYKEV